MATTVHSPTAATSRTNAASLTACTLAGTSVAVTANTLVWALGRLGEPIRVVIGANTQPLPWAHVAITTTMATVLGGVTLAVVRRRGWPDRVWTITALTIAVVSAMPLWRLDIDATSKTLLTVMHLLTGLCCVTALLARHPDSTRPPSGLDS